MRELENKYSLVILFLFKIWYSYQVYNFYADEWNRMATIML
jgi:hypothetical protein